MLNDGVTILVNVRELPALQTIKAILKLQEHSPMSSTCRSGKCMRKKWKTRGKLQLGDTEATDLGCSCNNEFFFLNLTSEHAVNRPSTAQYDHEPIPQGPRIPSLFANSFTKS